MPPSDYRQHAHHAATAAAAAPFLWMRLRALWSRIRHRGTNSIEGHRVL